MGLAPFSAEHDLPANYEEAYSRLLYVALNTLRVDVGNADFGDVTAVLSPSYWRDAVAAAAVDAGLYTFRCNETYRRTPGAFIPPNIDQLPFECGAGEPTPGVAGAMDHVTLNNHLLWGRRENVLCRNIRQVVRRQ